MRRTALDRIEIGDIDRLERREREKALDDIRRFARRRQRRFNRRIKMPFAHAGTHHLAAHEIDDGNDFHVEAWIKCGALHFGVALTLMLRRLHSSRLEASFETRFLPKSFLRMKDGGSHIGSLMQSIIGWDIGGAHLKGARCEDGRIVKVVQVASPLWLGLDELHRAFAEAKAILGDADHHVATMTGELADAFASREAGVSGLAQIAAADLQTQDIRFYAGAKGFVALADVAGHFADIASANWHASASLIGLTHHNALFVDMGSTTTDLISIIDAKVKTLGTTDASRLAHGELVYAGVVRSFLMSSGARFVPFEGRWVPLMNEWFASTSDIYRVLGELPEEADLMATADNAPKTIEASAIRIARMLGYDGHEYDLPAWQRLAAYFAEVQLRDLTDGCHLILSRGEIATDAPIIGAGAGRFVVKRLAQRLQRAFIDYADLIPTSAEVKEKAPDCAPACAVALLAASALRA